MSTFFKFLVAALVWLLFYLITFRGCQEELCLACDPPPPVTVADTLQEDAGLPVYFKWSDAEAYIGKGVEAFLQKQVMEGDSLQLLEITGLYFEGEKTAAGSGNLGLARAGEVARLFDGLLDSTRLQLRARQVEAPEEAQSAPFEGALFQWVDPKSQSAVDQLADRVSIRFPTGSADRVYAPEVDSFLIELAEQLRSSGQRVRITGHTDNTGSAEKNVGLGLARAEAVKQFLVKAGVSASQVATDSKGDAQPVGSNATEEGRYQNRRVEVRIEPQ
jgi:outer membrane protein OmpA-like peptidoglycan-associated protein